MVIWGVLLSSGLRIDEKQIGSYPNPKNYTPWLQLLDYCEEQEVTITEIWLWDEDNLIRLYSPGRLATKTADSIDFRRRSITEGTSSNNAPTEVTGIVISKNSVTFGVWFNSRSKEIFTTIE